MNFPLFHKSCASFVLLCFLASCGSLSKLDDTETESLNLNKLGLTEIPEEVYNMKNLKVLRLYGNKVDSISPRIQELTNLEKLYIGKNKLTHFPPEIGQLSKLKLLSAQYNDIRFLTSAIGKLDSLEQLILNQNQLTSLPVEIGGLKNLKSLQLNFNWISFIPDEIGNCRKLEFVQLNRNNLTAIPASFENLTQLRELHLVNAGNLVDLPEGLCKLRRLELLEIDQFTVVPTCLLVMQTTRLRILQH